MKRSFSQMITGPRRNLICAVSFFFIFTFVFGTGCGKGPENGLTAVVFDRFDRADSPGNLGKSETGQSWVSGPWGVMNSQAVAAAGAAGIALTETYQTEIMVRVSMPTTAAGCGVVLRASDSNNYWFFYNAGGAYRVAKVVAGVIADQLAFVPGIDPSPADGDLLTFQTAKTHIIASVNGKVKITNPTVFDNFNLANTLHGFGCTTGSSLVRFDNLSIQTGELVHQGDF